MKRRIATLSILFAAALTLTSCAGGESTDDAAANSQKPASATPASTPEAAAAASSGIIPCNGPSCEPNGGLFPVGGKYEFSSEYDTTGTFEFDGTPSAEAESLRKIAKADPIHYMNVEVDNRKGGEYANMYAVTGYDADGKKYEYKYLSDFVDSWRDTVDTDASGGTDAYNRYITFGNELNTGLDRSEAGTVTLAYQGDLPPDGFTRVNVQAHGGMSEGVDAYLEGQEPPNMDGAVGSGATTMEECMTELATINAEIDGVTIESLMDDPTLKEACVGELANQGGN